MPPLRQRPSDLPKLVLHFIDKVCRLEQIPQKRLAEGTLDHLATYPWPGNVRQLENAVEMAVVLSGERPTLYARDFALPYGPAHAVCDSGFTPMIPLPEGGLDFEQTVNHIERSILEQALRRTRGNKKMAAEMLRLKRTTLSAKLRSLDAAV
jgi:DNA-binding NtrC family response regulator